MLLAATVATLVPGASAAGATRGPVISHVRMTHHRFRVGGRSTASFAAKHAGVPFGTKFEVNVSERATIVLAFAGEAFGHKSGGSCILGSGHGPRCIEIVVPGSIARADRGPGRVSISFSGRLDGHALPAGRYAVGVTAVDKNGKRAPIKFMRFTVVSA
jgi:hypothetical protein